MIEQIERVNGVELFIRRFGDPRLPVLLVVHGGPGWDHSYLLPQVSTLADRRHVVMFDLRGCGRSSRVPPRGSLPADSLQPDLLADDIGALLDRFGGGAGVVLGFSYGGEVAIRAVEQHGSQIERLILASTTAYPDFASELEASADYQSRKSMVADVDFTDGPRFAEDASGGALSRAMAFGSIPFDVWQLDRRAEWETVLDGVVFSDDWNEPYLSRTLRPGLPADPERVLLEWGQPALILHGAHDLGFPIGVARRLRTAVPASTLVEVPEAAHMAHFDNPDVWLAAIRDFLQ